MAATLKPDQIGHSTKIVAVRPALTTTVLTFHISQLNVSWIVSIFVNRPRDFGWFSVVGRRQREAKPLNSLQKITQSVLPNFRIADMQQNSLFWLCQNEVHYNNLRTGTNGVQLFSALKHNHAVLLLFRRWYCLLKNIKSIRELVMFKITNVNVGHLYNFSDFIWRKTEQSYDSTQLIMRFVILW